MKYITLTLIVFIFNSCQYFNLPNASDKDVLEKKLLEKELNTINWKEVDEYPSFVDCNKIEDKQERQHCFFQYLTELIQSKLGTDTLAALYPKLDTIEVKVTVYPDAKMKFEPQYSKDSMAYDVVKIDSLLRSRLVDFPKVNPAIKRGIPVKTQFVLPVIIKVE